MRIELKTDTNIDGSHREHRRCICGQTAQCLHCPLFILSRRLPYDFKHHNGAADRRAQKAVRMNPDKKSCDHSQDQRGSCPRPPFFSKQNPQTPQQLQRNKNLLPRKMGGINKLNIQAQQNSKPQSKPPASHTAHAEIKQNEADNPRQKRKHSHTSNRKTTQPDRSHLHEMKQAFHRVGHPGLRIKKAFCHS